MATQVVDAVSADFSPGAVAVRGRRVAAVGEPGAVRRAVDDGAEVIDLGEHVVMPGLVNAHCHLDLTSVGPRPYGGDFIEWVKMVIAARPRDASAVAESVRRGAAYSAAGGTLTVGDIAGCGAVDGLENRAGLRGVMFDEMLGINRTAAEARVTLAESDDEPGRSAVGWRRSVSPHAPYSTSPAMFYEAAAWAAARGLPITTHLAETAVEAEFVARGSGAFRELLIERGLWGPVDDEDDPEASTPTEYLLGLSPVMWLDEMLEETDARVLLAHVNYADDADLERIGERGWSVAYCPRAAAYFGHAGHRYREMLEAGLAVGLGTDSIICHGSLSVWDEMRFLRKRDGIDARTLLAMATIHGASGLGMDWRDVTFNEGSTPGVIAVAGTDLAAALDGGGEPEVVVGVCDGRAI